MALSDFDAEVISGLEELDDDAATLTAIVLDCRACSGGFLLDLSDGMGGGARAFCPADLMNSPLPPGTAVIVTVQRSSGDPDFLYIREISPAPATGKD
jgi:hypothetical protein